MQGFTVNTTGTYIYEANLSSFFQKLLTCYFDLNLTKHFFDQNFLKAVGGHNFIKTEPPMCSLQIAKTIQQK